MVTVNDDDYKLKDSGERREFSTGSVRDKVDGKGAFYLLPFRALRCVAIVMEKGKAKYGESNWTKGQPICKSFLDSAMRHLSQVMMGQKDEDHLAAAAWNVMCALDTRERIREGLLPQELDDIPRTAKASYSPSPENGILDQATQELIYADIRKNKAAKGSVIGKYCEICNVAFPYEFMVCDICDTSLCMKVIRLDDKNVKWASGMLE